ncbi:MAG: hypothetical protein U0359_32095 [Byssovorax sp.]
MSEPGDRRSPRDDDRLDWPGGGLSAFGRRVVMAFAEALLADEDASGVLVPGPPSVCARATDGLDRAIGRGSADLRRGFAVLTVAMELLPLFVIGAPSRMSRLPLARRIAYLEALETSRFGWFPLLIVAFKVPLSIPAFETEELLAETGFDRPDTTARRRLPRADEATEARS